MPTYTFCDFNILRVVLILRSVHSATKSYKSPVRAARKTFPNSISPSLCDFKKKRAYCENICMYVLLLDSNQRFPIQQLRKAKFIC